jgi:DNA-binding MarR family transcriptional regulator
MKSKASNSVPDSASEAHGHITRQVTEVMDYLRIIFKALRESSSQFEKQVGLSAAQVFVLRQLHLESELSINDLAEKTKTHQSSVSVVVKKLEERGLVLRKVSEADSRRFQISISPKGHDLLGQLPVSVQEHLIAAIERLPDADRARLVSLMHTMVQGAGLLSGETVEMLSEN